MRSSLVRPLALGSALAALLATGCGSPVDAPAETYSPEAAPSSQQAPGTTSPDAFVGYWRSVTPSLEFVRLRVSPLSVSRESVGIELAFSGVMWEGGGRVHGDSAVIPATTMRGGEPIGTVVLRAGAGARLAAELRSASASPMVLTFVRER